MPKVPQYQESQRFGNAPDARFTVNGRALTSALGGETWGAVDRAGRQMRATGEQMGGIALDLMREHNETVAMDHLNRAEAAILDMQTEQALRKGRDALGDAVASGSELIAQAAGGSGLAGPHGAAAGAGKDGKSVGVTGTLRAGLDKLRVELAQGMNPAQQKLFDAAFTRREQGVIRWGAGWEAQQREVYTTSAEDGLKAVQGQRILARYQDPEQVSSALGNIQYVEERRGKRLGLAPEAVEANVTRAMQKALLPMFDAMLDKGELGQARNALQLFGPDLGAGTAAAVQAKIQARADALQAKAEAERKKAEEARLDALGESVWQDTTGLAWEQRRETALEMIAARTEDPEERRKLLDAFDSNAEFQKVAEKAQQSRRIREIVENARAENLRPTEFLQRIHGNPALSEEDSALAWEKFQGKIEETPANRLALGDLKREKDRRLREGRPMSEAEIEAWGIDHRATDAQIKAAHEYDGKASGVAITDLESLWKKAGGGKAPDDLHAIVVDMLEDGKKPTKEDLEKIVRNLAWDGEVQGGGWGHGKNMNWYQSLGTEKEGTWLPDESTITGQEKEQGEAFLTEKNWPITSLTLRVYAKVARGIPHAGITSLAAWPEFAAARAAKRENAPGTVPAPSPAVAAVAPVASSSRAVVPPTEAGRTAVDDARRKAMREDSATGGASYRQVAEESRNRAGVTLTPLPLPEALQDLPENADVLHHDYVVVFGELPPAGMSESDMKTAIQDRIEEDLDTSIFSGAYARQVRALRVAYLKEHLRGDVRHPGTGKRPKDWK